MISINYDRYGAAELNSQVKNTFVRVTLGIIVLRKALGASLGALLLSPPGWYWYLKCSSAPFLPVAFPSTCQGIDPSAMLTDASDEDDVGLVPVRGLRVSLIHCFFR